MSRKCILAFKVIFIELDLLYGIIQNRILFEVLERNQSTNVQSVFHIQPFLFIIRLIIDEHA